MIFFRLTTVLDPEKAFSGEGAKRYGGRWNSKGTALVYAASSLSLAIVEALVHVDSDILPPYFYFRIGCPEGVIVLSMEATYGAALPAGWDAEPPTQVSQRMGDDWIRSGSSCVLTVPSLLVPGEQNVLINPNHADFRKLRISRPEPFAFNRRLLRKPK